MLPVNCGSSKALEVDHIWGGAERGIKKIKTYKKISTQSNTKEGANALETITSIVQTCTLKQINSKETIETILNKGVPKFLD